MPQGPHLRIAALRGGLYLAGRQVVSICLKLMGVVLITRVLGPAKYGAYVSGISIYNYALALGAAGVGVFLLRYEGDVPEATYGTAYSVLVATGVLLLASIELGAHALAGWTGVAGFEPVMRIIILGLPIQLLAMPAGVRLERQLNYRSVATIEIMGQVAFYALAPILVMLKFGAVSLAVAWVLLQVVMCLGNHLASKSYPRFAFEWSAARSIVRYAADFSVANWIWQLRNLVNPLIVGPALGARAVGIVGMTVGILEMLSILKTIAWRLSIAILTKFRSDLDKLRSAVTEGMELQVLALGVILLGFGWTGRFIVPRLFGPQWIDVMVIYPYIAVSYLTQATFNIHSATLSVLSRNRDLAIYNFLSVLTFIGVAYFAVPKFGMFGYGYADLATIPSYVVMHTFVARAIGSPDYRLVSTWWFGVTAGLFWQFGIFAVAVPFLVLLLPASLRRLRKLYGDVRQRA
jgi:O-antigen/teichoic acid export membrane protein